MSSLFRKIPSVTSRSSGSWLMLLLLLAVMAPSVFLLWFMNQAARNERLAVRQKLVDAYRGHLSLAQERLEAHLKDSANALDTAADKLPASALFAQEIRAGRADALICLDSTGRVVYPSVPLVETKVGSDAAWVEARRLETSDPRAAANAYATLAQFATNATLAGRALQAQARCLVQAGDRDAAVAVLLGPLAEERFKKAADSQGRLIAPNAQLMALELLKDAGGERSRAPLARLKSQVLDYNDASLSSPQRRFLMRELLRFDSDPAILPLLAAEDLAASFVEAGSFHSGPPGLYPSSLPGVWLFPSSRNRVITLHKVDHNTQPLLTRFGGTGLLEALPSDAHVNLLAPGQDAETFFTSLPAGPSLAGWRLALSLNDQNLFATAADQRIASYAWIGFLMMATVIVLAALALRLVRRQMALTQLRNDLVANVTHELKTPLSSMRLLVETLLNSAKLDEQTAREYLQLIAQENLRLSRLIDNFLTFSRMERNKYAFGFKPVSASDIVAGASAAVRERFHTPGCDFQVQSPTNLPDVVVDPDAMVTALVNLLDNAYKYSGDEKRITLIAGAGNGAVSFSVRDNGIGLSPRETKRIFKRFYQVDQRLSRPAGGCGLGLSIVKFIVTAHQGSVHVESQPGQGSTFTITLPTAERHPSEDAAATAISQSSKA